MAENDRARGRQIQALRRAAGHRSAEKAAQVAGVSHRAFQNWEAGGEVKHENLPGLAKALKVGRETIEAMFPEPPLATPDLLAPISPSINGRIGELEQALVGLADEVSRLSESVSELLARQAAQAASEAVEEPARRARASRRKPPAKTKKAASGGGGGR